MKQYLKMIASVIGTILAALVPILSVGGPVTAAQWINVAIVGVGACIVFTSPNIPGAAYTKSIISGAMAALTLLTTLVSNGVTLGEWIQVVLAFGTAAGVLVLKNTDKDGNNLSYVPGVPNRDPVTGRFISLRPVDGKDAP